MACLQSQAIINASQSLHSVYSNITFSISGQNFDINFLLARSSSTIKILIFINPFQNLDNLRLTIAMKNLIIASEIKVIETGIS
jgi:hypothetical protein